jgi:hypothetical protein
MRSEVSGRLSGSGAAAGVCVDNTIRLRKISEVAEIGNHGST